MKISKRLKDIDGEYSLPNECPECGKETGYLNPSQFTFILDDNDHAVAALCSKRCAKKYLARK
jgi:endogenous inhibitor of DNA gyrase (YacG/DUF329 family)